eukprot:1160909-Pelagomonas_calceolata.AAC.9
MIGRGLPSGASQSLSSCRHDNEFKMNKRAMLLRGPATAGVPPSGPVSEEKQSIDLHSRKTMHPLDMCQQVCARAAAISSLRQPVDQMQPIICT